MYKEETETQAQQRVIKWANAMLHKYNCLRWLYAIPNAANRDKIHSHRMKAEGMKAGVSDLCLPCPNKNYHGLYIEMKRQSGKNKPTELQKEFIEFVVSVGYYGCVCYGADDTIEIIKKYLENRL